MTDVVAKAYEGVELGDAMTMKKEAQHEEDEHVIYLSALPEEVAAALAPLDLDGDGTISVAEILALRGKQ